MTGPTWGDTVRIRENAPSKWRPGAYADVCGITEIETADQARTFECPIGTMVYLVEFTDGSDVEVPENFVEEDPKLPWHS